MKNFYIWFFVVLLILICLSTGYYYTIFERKENILPEKTPVVINPLVELDQKLIDLEISKNFWENKLKLADQDHYNVFINLSDSLVSLEMSGITAHYSKILNFEIAEIFDCKDEIKILLDYLKNHFIFWMNGLPYPKIH